MAILSHTPAETQRSHRPLFATLRRAKIFASQPSEPVVAGWSFHAPQAGAGTSSCLPYLDINCHPEEQPGQVVQLSRAQSAELLPLLEPVW